MPHRCIGLVLLPELTRRNIGTLDRIVRVVLAIALIAPVFYGPAARWGWLGLVPLLTGVAGSRPLYRLLGIHTYHDDGQPRAA